MDGPRLLGEAFDLGLGSGGETCSLQDAFKGFLKRRKLQLRERHSAEVAAAQKRAADPGQMQRLREKFLQTALTYLGVPYARKYHEPDSPTYHSPLFLDCCGLVRRVLRDMREDLGFTAGPWNQAYQFDTLPLALPGPEQMQPGDLVFISGIYFNPRSKPQKHNIVHVEIWLGDGEKTVGARWQRGRVQVHDSYQFVSKSYHSMQYHFRSIDTWLQGECRSVCPDHSWSGRQFRPGKYSVFAGDQSDGGEEEESDRREEEEGEEEADIDKLEELLAEQAPHSEKGEGYGTMQCPIGTGGSSSPHKHHHNQQPSQLHHAPSKSSGRQGRGPASPHQSAQPQTGKGRQTSHSGVRGRARTFIVCGGNGASLVRDALLVRGWVQMEDSSSTSFTLKWVETNKQINHREFREGEQLVNHFPNISILTTKIGLLESLRAFERLQHTAGMRGPRPTSFVPETYRLDVEEERSEFMKVYSPGDMWICKPTGANQGKGIFIVRDLQEIVDKLECDQKHCKMASRPTARVAQRYISSPLLLEGRKFDIRVYLLIIAARPYLVLYRDGYIRLSCLDYDPASSEPCVHLTNQYQQKKHPMYAEKKDETVWDFSRFQAYLTSHHSLPDDWVASTLTRRMKAVMTTCFQSVRNKLSHKLGYFDLLGFDFMLDAELNLWLIEVNVNPALHTNCSTLLSIVPSVVEETLDIAIEVFDKCRRHSPSLLPLSSIRNFTLLQS